MLNSKAAIWTGRVLTALAVVFWTLDGVIKLGPMKEVTDTLNGLGFHATPELARGLGLLQLGCLVLYLFPRTAIVGAILLTGYLGGAIAVNLRVENPLFSHVLFGAYVGLVTWAGLLLRDERARSLLFRK
jgi:hypothetical protein